MKILAILSCLTFTLCTYEGRAADFLISWNAPAELEDGTPISAVDSYSIYHLYDNQESKILVDGSVNSYLIENAAIGDHEFTITSTLGELESDKSASVNASILAPVVIESQPKAIKILIRIIE